MASPNSHHGAQIILMYPRTGIDQIAPAVSPPHSILAVAAPVHRAGYTVKIIDMRRDLNWRQTLANSLGSDTLLIGISTMTGTQIRFALAMAAEARKLTDGKVPLVWGGPHPSILPEQTAKHPMVDIVVAGEGEDTFVELVKALENKQPLDKIQGLAFKNGSEIVLTPPRPLLDVNTLLPVPWDLVTVEDYIMNDSYFLKNSPRTLDIGQTSRGCPHRCGFCCSSSILEKKWRPMSIEKSLEVILEPVKRFHLTGIWIRDDEFYVKNSRAFTICEKILNSEHRISWFAAGSRVDDFNRATDEQLSLLKKSGGRVTKFGAESGSDRILDLINKGFHVEDIIKANERCKKHGIIPAYSFVIGFPTQTFEEIDATIDLAFSLKESYPAVQLEHLPTYTAYPVTPMWALALSMGARPPESLDGWIGWVLDDYDREGVRNPWYNSKERRWLGNINYMSLIAHTANNVRGSIDSWLMRTLLTLYPRLTQSYYRTRLKNKMYRSMPELRAVSYLRKKLFFEREHSY